MVLLDHGHSLRRYRQPPEGLSPGSGQRRRDREPGISRTASTASRRASWRRSRRWRSWRSCYRCRCRRCSVSASNTLLPPSAISSACGRSRNLRAHHRARRPDLLPARVRRLRPRARRHPARKHSRYAPRPQARARSGRRDHRGPGAAQGAIPTPPARHRQSHLRDRDGALSRQRPGRPPRAAGQGPRRAA